MTALTPSLVSGYSCAKRCAIVVISWTAESSVTPPFKRPKTSRVVPSPRGSSWVSSTKGIQAS